MPILGTKEVDFRRLTDYNWSKNKDIMVAIESIQNLYLNSYSGSGEVHPISIEDGKVNISRGMINHRCDYSMDTLRNLSKIGIVATEWFGIVESEREGCFCSFVSRMKGEDYPYKGSLAEDDHSRLNIGKDVLLFLDEDNETMKKLLHLDYFEYANLKENGVDVNSLYTEEKIKMLELIYSVSPCGRSMRKDFNFKTNYWSAIPGGIPPFIVNGVCIKKINYNDEELDEISNLYPNAVIFNNDLKVIRKPLVHVDNDVK